MHRNSVKRTTLCVRAVVWVWACGFVCACVCVFFKGWIKSEPATHLLNWELPSTTKFSEQLKWSNSGIVSCSRHIKAGFWGRGEYFSFTSPSSQCFPASLELKNNNLEVRKMVTLTAWRWKDRHKNGRNIVLSAVIVAITLWNLVLKERLFFFVAISEIQTWQVDLF